MLLGHWGTRPSEQKGLTSTLPNTCNADNLDAPTRCLQYLTDSAIGLQDALKRGFAIGFKIAWLDLEISLEDDKVKE